MVLVREQVRFFSQFLRHPFQVGALLPSSRLLATCMVKMSGITRASSVVELGSGTGVVTEVIRCALPPGATFFAIEVNPVFVQATRNRCPLVTVYQRSAVDLPQLLTEEGVEKVDTIISSLPWASFSYEEQDRILEVITHALAVGGEFITFMYSASPFLPAGRRFHRELQRRFDHLQKSPLVWRNIPPAIVYRAW